MTAVYTVLVVLLWEALGAVVLFALAGKDEKRVATEVAVILLLGPLAAAVIASLRLLEAHRRAREEFARQARITEAVIDGRYTEDFARRILNWDGPV